MVKDLPRKCSCCGNNGHNSRTCNGNGKPCVKLFGVNISETKVNQSIKKSFSMGNLKAGGDEDHEENVGNVNGDVVDDDSGYLSDGLIHNKRRKDAHERKKGIPWSEEEHRTFLAGLKRLGKGNWREIARTFVTTRTPTQVASHAQKYFLRQAANDKKKRRSSLFDMHLKEPEAVRKTPSVSTAGKLPEISPEVIEKKAPISPTLALKNMTESQQQVNAAKLVNRFPHLCLDSSPVLPVGATTAGCLPNYHRLPYLVGVPANVSFIPVMNFGRQDLIATCEPVIGHSSGIPSSPKPFPQIITTPPDPGQSEKDGLALELKIGQPQTSGSIIRVT